MALDLEAALEWRPSSSWRRIRTIDAHTGGEPFRVVIEGGPDIPGDTILAKRRWAEDNADGLRRLLMWEPRGHADMYGCFLTEPVSSEADFGILFIHNAGFSTMCGHGIIAATKVVIDTGIVSGLAGVDDLAVEIGIDSPAGLIHATAQRREGRSPRSRRQLDSVSFRNVPSFAVDLDATIALSGYGTLAYDLAFGGAFYAFVDASSVGLSCTPDDFGRLVEAGRAIKQAVMASREIAHPFEPDLGFLYGVIFTGPPADANRHSRHVCVFADGEVDRSPTGTGVSARLAILHARGEAAVDEPLCIESLIGSHFAGKVVAETSFGPYPAIVPEIEGTASLTGRHEFLLDPNDQFAEGFFLR